jgi:hypothetical protein
MLEDGLHKISLDRLLSLPQSVRTDLVNMFWHNGMFDCKTASALENFESAAGRECWNALLRACGAKTRDKST